MNQPSSAAIASGFFGHLPGMLPTEHAEVRMRERGFDHGVLYCLHSYGRRKHDHCGAEVIVHHKGTLEQVRRHETPAAWRAVDGARGLYALVGSVGMGITTAHRFRRAIRDISLPSLRPRVPQRAA